MNKCCKKNIYPIALLIVFIFSAVLTACNRRADPIAFAPVTIQGFEIEIETSLNLQSDRFSLQGHLIEDDPLAEEALLPLLEELEIDLPDIPTIEFIFELELLSYEFYHEASDDDIYPRLPPLPTNSRTQIAHDGIVTLSPITFEHAGIFTYRISQINEADHHWQLSNAYVEVIVTISEHLESERLEATIMKKNEPVFINIFEYDISEAVRTVIQDRWEAHVAQAYEDGYEYIKNEDGEYERVAKYVPQPVTEPPTVADILEPTSPPATEAIVTSPPEASGIPEDNAVTLSDGEALSYLALINRNFRMASHFVPGNLSVVNVQSIQGQHSLRASAARAAETLFQAALDEENLTLVAVSGFRSYATQTMVHNNFINTMGVTEARRVSARPGHSEHQLGLALDVTSHALSGLTQQFSSTPEGIWVRNNAHRFGFIIRYPAGREADTGYIYEPWHIRFVGIDAATQIFNGGLILEEFLGH